MIKRYTEKLRRVFDLITLLFDKITLNLHKIIRFIDIMTPLLDRIRINATTPDSCGVP